MSNPAMLNPHPAFEFISSVLTSIVGHQCDCAHCQMNRHNASLALMWLIAATTDVEFIGESAEGEGRELFHIEPDGVPPVPQVVIEMVAKRLLLDNVPDDERAQLAGWLERVGEWSDE